ncbi:MAG: hypothetical protein R3F37_18490 [Candidatus Competibacteraceae bacterium]
MRGAVFISPLFIVGAFGADDVNARFGFGQDFGHRNGRGDFLIKHFFDRQLAFPDQFAGFIRNGLDIVTAERFGDAPVVNFLGQIAVIDAQYFKRALFKLTLVSGRYWVPA